MNISSRRIFQFVCIIFISSLGTKITAQDLTEMFKGVKTEYEITWQANPLDVIDQAIYKRGLSRSFSEEEPILEYAYGYGYGMQTYQLEFMTKTNVDVITNQKAHRKFRYLIQLISDNDTTLLKMALGRNEITKYTNGADLQIININLQHMPLIALEKARSIFITYGKY